MGALSRATTPPANDRAAKASTQRKRLPPRRGKIAALGNAALTGRIVDLVTAGRGIGRDDWRCGVELGIIGAGRVDTLRDAGPGGGTGTRCRGSGGDQEGGRIVREDAAPTARTGGNCAYSSFTPLATLISIARSLLDSTLAIADPLLREPRPQAVRLYTSINPTALGNWSRGAFGIISAGYGHVMGVRT